MWFRSNWWGSNAFASNWWGGARSTQGNTPGRITNLPRQWLGETEEHKLARRLAQGTIKVPVSEAQKDDLHAVKAAAQAHIDALRKGIERAQAQAQAYRELALEKERQARIAFEQRRSIDEIARIDAQKAALEAIVAENEAIAAQMQIEEFDMVYVITVLSDV